ncbi:hypothetical protein [Microbacterium enclense]|uniref:hypothetical protein n=1 Tax=Microbacterium enclense TaxID=993073 RepID=UPI003F8080FE
MSPSIERLMISVGGVTYALAPTEHVDDLKAEITHQVRSGGGFVDVTIDDGQRLSFLITPASTVTIAAKTVHLDIDGADRQGNESWGAGTPITYDGDSPYDLI